MLVNHLYAGDCVEVMKNEISDGAVQVIVADPPYNLSGEDLEWEEKSYKKVNEDWDKFSDEDYLKFTKDWLTESHRTLAPNGSIFVCCSHHNIAEVKMTLKGLNFETLHVITWFKCLAGSTQVYAQTANGVGPASLKDLVRLNPSTVKLWTGKKWSNVKSWAKNDAVVSPLKITLRSGEILKCTGNHRWPTSRGLLEASELKVGDVLEHTRLPEPEVPECPSGLTDELVGWFVGLYLAEGSLSNNIIQISSHSAEEERFKKLSKLAAAFHGTCRIYKLEGHTATANLTGSVLLGILKTYISGRDAYSKRLTRAVWERDNKFVDAVVKGYLDGDGHFDEGNDRYRLNFTGRNHMLASDLRVACARLGYSLRLNLRKSELNGVQYPAYRGELRFTSTTRHTEDFEIIKIENCPKMLFWDVAIEDEPHLYALASGVLTHNTNAMPNKNRRSLTHSSEFIIWAVKGPNWIFNYEESKRINPVKGKTGKAVQMRDVWLIPFCGGKERLRGADGKSIHSTQKPEALIERILRISTEPGSLVLDPFMGSGTTAVVAKRMNLPWVGIEKEQKYILPALDRISRS